MSDAVPPPFLVGPVVLCPGGAYDRSPCGTGTSAKIACLAADGKLAEGETWVQESIIGSTFSGRYRRDGGGVFEKTRATSSKHFLHSMDFPLPDGWSATSTGAPMSLSDTNTAGQSQRFYRLEAGSP